MKAKKLKMKQIILDWLDKYLPEIQLNSLKFQVIQDFYPKKQYLKPRFV